MKGAIRPACRSIIARSYSRTSHVRMASTTTDGPGTTTSSSATSSSSTTNPAPGPPKPNSPFTVFDRNAKQLQRSRAASRQNGQASRLTDYVREEAAANLAERLLDVKRKFETIVDLGSGAGHLRRYLQSENTGTNKVIMCDSSKSALYRDVDEDASYPCECHIGLENLALFCSRLKLYWFFKIPSPFLFTSRNREKSGRRRSSSF